MQPLTALLEGRALQAPCALKPEVSSGLLQASLPYRGVASGGIVCSLCLAMYVIMFIELCFNFISIFCVFFPSCGQSLSLCPASSSSCAIMLHKGMFDVPMNNLGSLGYFLA
jgi:hypothetical protein